MPKIDLLRNWITKSEANSSYATLPRSGNQAGSPLKRLAMPGVLASDMATPPTFAQSASGASSIVTSRTVADGVTNSTTTVTSATAAFTAYDQGTPISGAGIPAGTTILTVTNATTIVLSAPATASASGVSITIGQTRRAWPANVPLFNDSIRTGIGANQLLTTMLASQANSDAAWVSPTYWRRSFYTDAPTWDVQYRGGFGYLTILVDGQNVTPGGGPSVTIANDGQRYRTTVAHGSRKMRRIDIYLGNASGNTGYVEVSTGIADTILPAQKNLVCCVVGDSFTDGTGATNVLNVWCRQFEQLTGWTVVPVPWGGTGYLNNATSKQTFRTRLPNDVYPYNPDVVLWFGGYNDIGNFTAAAIGAEAALAYAAVTANLPNAKQVVVGPQWTGGAQKFTAALLDARDAIKTAALAAGAYWIDLLEIPVDPPGSFSTTLAAQASAGATTLSCVAAPSPQQAFFANGQQITLEIGAGSTRERRVVASISGSGPYTFTLQGNSAALLNTHLVGETVVQVGNPLWTGTGHVGATQSDGNSDLLVFTDGIHPTDFSHAAMARSIFRQLTRQLPAT